MTEIKGCGTALVTPFTTDNKVDFEAYQRLVEWQIGSGIDFLVPCGTTGESVTLSEEEYLKVIRTCVETASKAVPVVAGAGTNSTEHAIHLARAAQDAGADAILSVTPYYNKPTQEGIFQHFRAIAQALSIPVVFYNVPGRTGTNIATETQHRLAQEDGILGVKEASGSLDQIMEVLAGRPSNFLVLSGDDSIAFAVASLGGEGVISVASNLIPAEMTQMISLVSQGRLGEARALHFRYLNLMNLNFIESNPIPVKYALSKMGRMEEIYRLPLCSMADSNKEKMNRELERLDLVGTHA